MPAMPAMQNSMNPQDDIQESGDDLFQSSQSSQESVTLAQKPLARLASPTGDANPDDAMNRDLVNRLLDTSEGDCIKRFEILF
jgi:hypothetical protein